MEKRTILFDFDGVIADSFAAGFATAAQQCAHKTEALYRSMFEGNIYDAARVVRDASLDHAPCDHELDWWATFSSHFVTTKGLFDHMDAVVQRLATEYQLIIVSSSIHSLITPFLKTHGLTKCFTDIYDVDVHTNKAEKIGMVFEKYSLTPNDCVMITDTKGDILEAREKDVQSIAVTWGFNGYDVLLSADPWRIVRLPQELPNAVTDFFRGKSTSG